MREMAGILCRVVGTCPILKKRFSSRKKNRKTYLLWLAFTIRTRWIHEVFGSIFYSTILSVVDRIGVFLGTWGSSLFLTLISGAFNRALSHKWGRLYFPMFLWSFWPLCGWTYLWYSQGCTHPNGKYQLPHIWMRFLLTPQNRNRQPFNNLDLCAYYVSCPLRRPQLMCFSCLNLA